MSSRCLSLAVPWSLTLALSLARARSACVGMDRFLASTTAEQTENSRQQTSNSHPNTVDNQVDNTRRADSAKYAALDREEADVMSYLHSFASQDMSKHRDLVGTDSEEAMGRGEGGGGSRVEEGGARVGSADGEDDGDEESAGGEHGSKNGKPDGRAVGGREKGSGDTERDGTEQGGPMEKGGGWGEMRGKWRERAENPLREGQKFVHVEHDAATGVRFEFVDVAGNTYLCTCMFA